MKNLLLSIFTILLTSFYSYGQNDEIYKDINHLRNIESSHAHEIISQSRNDLTKNYDLKYHRLEWEVDPAIDYISGTITSYFVPTEEVFNQINFDFLPNMTINEISYHGESLDYIFVDENLQIELPVEISIGTLDSISISYEGKPQSAGFGSFEVNTHGPNDTPVMWTLSEPYGAKAWWPCKQDLNDKIDSIDIFVKTPAIYRTASNGKLMSEEVNGMNKVYYWKHRHPIPAYLIAIAVTDYAVYSDYVITSEGDSIEILNYVYPESLELAQNATKNSIEIMELFNNKFGIYPFADEKYGHTQFGWGGGMEHQTMSFMGGFSYALQAHEMAHQWFGDKVTCGSWEDIWLNEGFATYLTGLTYQYLRSEQTWSDWKAEQLESITSQPGGSVWIDDTTSVNRIFSGRLSYNKGSYLLHMLRWKLGDEKFFEGVKNYVSDPELTFNYARTDDLIMHLESVSGLELDEFFQDWFYNQGYPSYTASWETSANGVSINLSQTTSHTSVDFFEMPVPIAVSGEGQDTILVIDHFSNNQIEHFDLPFVVDSMKIDPHLWLISDENNVIKIPTTTSDILNNQELVEFVPNPFSDFIEVKSLVNDVVINRVKIYDNVGRLVYELDKTVQESRINTTDWQTGAYIITTITETGINSSIMIKH